MFRPRPIPHYDTLWERELRDSEQKRKEKARHSREGQVELHRRLEKLSIVCRAMRTLLQDRSGLTEKELSQRTTEIDLLDGKADGRVSVPARTCSGCGHTVAPRHDRCLYCGRTKLTDTVFETV